MSQQQHHHHHHHAPSSDTISLLGRLLANQSRIEKRHELRFEALAGQLASVEAIANSILLRLAHMELEQHQRLAPRYQDSRARSDP